MIKTEVKIEITLKVEAKKVTAEAVEKENIAPEGDPQGRRLRARIRWEVDASKALLEKRSNATTVRSWDIMLTIALNPSTTLKLWRHL